MSRTYFLSTTLVFVSVFYQYDVSFFAAHAGGALGYNDQKITYRDYANMYYRDFFSHTREKRSTSSDGDAGLIMSRPVDCLIDGVSKVRASVGSVFFPGVDKLYRAPVVLSVHLCSLLMLTQFITLTARWPYFEIISII
jgi:hypothetical protein